MTSRKIAGAKVKPRISNSVLRNESYSTGEWYIRGFNIFNALSVRVNNTEYIHLAGRARECGTYNITRYTSVQLSIWTVFERVLELRVSYILHFRSWKINEKTWFLNLALINQLIIVI